LAVAAPAHGAAGRFEAYCDGIGFFLTKVEGAPIPGKLLLFLYTDFPAVTPEVPKGEWTNVLVYRNGCAADGKCEVLAHGRVRLDNKITHMDRQVSGEYEIDLGGRHLHGQFEAKRRAYKLPPRICA
jgi:hypothetical protein